MTHPFDVAAITDANMGLNPVARIRESVINYLVLADDGIGHDDHSIVTGAYSGGPDTNFHYITPGSFALNLDPVADAIRLVGQDNEPGDSIGKSVLGS